MIDILKLILIGLEADDIKSLSQASKLDNYMVSIALDHNFFSNRLRFLYPNEERNLINYHPFNNESINTEIHRSLLCRMIDIHDERFDDPFNNSTERLPSIYQLLDFSKQVSDLTLLNLCYYFQHNDKRYIKYDDEPQLGKGLRNTFRCDASFFAKFICKSIITTDSIVLAIINWMGIFKRSMINITSLKKLFEELQLIQAYDHLFRIAISIASRFTGEQMESRGYQELITYVLGFLRDNRVVIYREIGRTDNRRILIHMFKNELKDHPLSELYCQVFINEDPYSNSMSLISYNQSLNISSDIFSSSDISSLDDSSLDTSSSDDYFLVDTSLSDVPSGWSLYNQIEKIIKKKLTIRSGLSEEDMAVALDYSRTKNSNIIILSGNFRLWDLLLEIHNPSDEDYYTLVTNSIINLEPEILQRLLLDQRAKNYNPDRFCGIFIYIGNSEDEIYSASNRIIAILRILSTNSVFDYIDIANRIIMSLDNKNNELADILDKVFISRRSNIE